MTCISDRQKPIRCPKLALSKMISFVGVAEQSVMFALDNGVREH